MVELDEMRVGDNEITLNDNLVKTSILPQTSKELSRNVKVQNNVTFESAVFGNNINVEGGNVAFEGAVYAATELHINSDVTGDIVFKKAVASADSIVALMTSQRVIFGSDINASGVRLKNCYVGGSVFGSEVYLENCVVLGGVFATKQASIDNCIVGTFNAPSVELTGTNYLLYPAGFSVEPLTSLPQTELYNISLAHLGALYKGEKEDARTGKIKMDIDKDSQRTVLVGDDQSTTIVNSYSVSARVLAADVIDLDKLENHFLIGAGALGSQVLKTYSLTKEDGNKSEDLTVANISKFFFDILDGIIQIQDLSGEISFEELKKNFQ